MDQGSSYSYTFTLVNPDNSAFDLTGFDARLHVRRSYGNSSVLIDCTVANSKLTITPLLGTVVLSLAPSDTSDIAFNSKDDDSLDSVYDLEIVSPASKVYKPARGTLTLTREVTR